MPRSKVEIQVELIDRLSKQYKKTAGNLSKADKKIIDSLKRVRTEHERTHRSISKGITGTKLLMGGLAGFMASRFVGAFLKAGSEVEDLTTQFKVLLGSTEAAEKRMKELAKFAETTPFQLKDVATASRILQTLTQGALASGKGLRLVGDVAAATGSDFQNLAIHVGRAYDGLRNNRPVGESMMRLQELGIVTGDVRAQIESLQKQGLGVQAWELLESQLSKSEGGMKELSKTVTGLTSTIKDQLSAAMRQMMESGVWDSLRSALTSVVAKMSQMINDGTFEAWGKALVNLGRTAKEFGVNLMKLRNFLHGVTETGNENFLSDPKVTQEVKNKVDELIKLNREVEKQQKAWKDLNVFQKVAGKSGREVEIARNKALLERTKIRDELNQLAGEGYATDVKMLPKISQGLGVILNQKKTELKLTKDLETEKTKKPVIPKIPAGTDKRPVFSPGGDPKQVEIAFKAELKRREEYEREKQRIIADGKEWLKRKDLEDEERKNKLLENERLRAEERKKIQIDLANSILVGASSFTNALSNLAAVRGQNEIRAAEKAGASEEKIQAIRKKSFQTQKRWSLTQAVINTAQAATAGYSQSPFIPVGLAAGTLALASGGVQISAIKAQKFNRGGVVQSAGPQTGDRVPAMLNPGERVLTKSQQNKFFSNGGGGNQITFEAPVINVSGGDVATIRQAVTETYQEQIAKLSETLKETQIQEVIA